MVKCFQYSNTIAYYSQALRSAQKQNGQKGLKFVYILITFSYWPGATRIFEKSPIFQKVAQKVSKPNKAQFESPKHVHQTTFESLKYLEQTMFFEAVYLGENVINLLK